MRNLATWLLLFGGGPAVVETTGEATGTGTAEAVATVRANAEATGEGLAAVGAAHIRAAADALGEGALDLAGAHLEAAGDALGEGIGTTAGLAVRLAGESLGEGQLEAAAAQLRLSAAATGAGLGELVSPLLRAAADALGDGSAESAHAALRALAEALGTGTGEGTATPSLQTIVGEATGTGAAEGAPTLRTEAEAAGAGTGEAVPRARVAAEAAGEGAGTAAPTLRFEAEGTGTGTAELVPPPWPVVRGTQIPATEGRVIFLEDGDQDRDDAAEPGPLAEYTMRPVASVPIILEATETAADYAAAFDEAFQRIAAAVGNDPLLGGLVAGVEIGLVARGILHEEEPAPPLGALEVEFAIEFEHTDRIGARRRAILEGLAAALATNRQPTGASQWETVLARIAVVAAAAVPGLAFVRNPDVPLAEAAGVPGTLAFLDGTLAPTGNAPTGAEDWAAACELWLVLEGDEQTMAATRADTWDALRGALRTDTVLAGLAHRITDNELDDVVPLLELGPSVTAFGLGVRAEFLTEEYDPAALAA